MTSPIRSTGLLLAAALSSLVTGCGDGTQQLPPITHSPRADVYAKCFPSASDCTTYRPSLIELVVRPEWYDGVRVSVEGILGLGDGESALYRSVEDYEVQNAANALWVPISGAQCRGSCAPFGGRWVAVTGRYRASQRGPSGAYGGGVVEVEGVYHFESLRGGLPPPMPPPSSPRGRAGSRQRSIQ